MAGRSLRAQLNQIRAWVREGRTDAWIAHQLEVPAAELRDFRRKHALTADDEPDGSADLRDAIEAEVEAATLADAESAAEEDEFEDEDIDDIDDIDGEGDAVADHTDEAGESDTRDEGDADGSERAPRRRRRRGGRGRRRGAGAIEATFDHGEKDGVGLWLDPAVQDNPVYAEHWAGHRPVEVSIEADQITIRRSGGD